MAQRRNTYKLDAETIFDRPAGLEKKGDFLVWVRHPWLHEMPLAPVVSFRTEVRKAIRDARERDVVRERAQRIANRPRGRRVLRTKAWSIVEPRTLREIRALAEVSPESFVLFELEHPPHWPARTYQVWPRFALTKKLPRRIETRILERGEGISEEEYDQYIGLDRRGLTASYNHCARLLNPTFPMSTIVLISRLSVRFYQQWQD